MKSIEVKMKKLNKLFVILYVLLFTTNIFAHGTTSASHGNGINKLLVLPPAVATAATNITTSSFTLNWDAFPGATDYYVRLGTSSGGVEIAQGYMASNAISWNVGFRISPNTLYYFSIKAVGAIDFISDWSNEITVLTLPGAPTATAESDLTVNSFTANWNAPPDGATGYRLDVNTASDFTGTAVYNNQIAAGTLFSVVGLNANTTYFYRVRAYNNTGTSDNSGNEGVLTLTEAPTITGTTPGSSCGTGTVTLGATASAGTINWYAASTGGASLGTGTSFTTPSISSTTTYYVDATDNGVTTASRTAIIATVNTPVTYYQDADADGYGGFRTLQSCTGAPIGYTTVSGDCNDSDARVHPGAAEVIDGLDNDCNGVADDITPPAAPTATAATNIISTGFTANWNAVAGATSYLLTVGTTNGGSDIYNNINVGNVTLENLIGLSSDTPYWYSVKAVGVGGTSVASNVILVTTLPSTPASMPATNITDYSFDANWDAVPGVAAYRLKVGTSSDGIDIFDDIVGLVTTQTIDILDPNSTYYYSIKAIGGSEESPISAASDEVQVLTLPEAPTATDAINVTTNSFDANWDAVATGADNYRLSVGTTSGGTEILNDEIVNDITLSVVGLSANTTYYYSVKAENGSGYSEPSNEIIVTTLSPPVNNAPVLASIEGTVLSFTEGDVAIEITNTITVSDVDDTNIESATVQIIDNYQNGQDFISFTSQNGITGSWNSGDGTMSLTGNSTKANYQTALRVVKYSNSSNNPNTANRIVNFIINDGELNSNTISREINVMTLNSPPVLSELETSSLDYIIKQHMYPITGTIKVNDNDDAQMGSATISIIGNYHKGEDKLIFQNQNYINGIWDETTGKLFLIGAGSVLDYQNAFKGVMYLNSSLIPSTDERTVGLIFSDGQELSNSVRRTIKMPTVNIAPLIKSLELAAIPFAKNDAKTNVSDDVEVNDYDNEYLLSGEVNITGGYILGEDVLEQSKTSNLTGIYDWSNGKLIIKGQATIAEYQIYMKNVQYKNIQGNMSTKSTKTITFIVNDGLINSNLGTRQIKVDGVVTDISTFNNEIPLEYVLYSNYPNPFNPSTIIRYALPQEGYVSLIIYNSLGQEVYKLANEIQTAGYHEIVFNASKLSSGLYIYRIKAGEFIQSKKMILMK